MKAKKKASVLISLLIITVLALAAAVSVMADTGPGTTYSSYCSKKWVPSGASTAKQYRAKLVTTTGADATQFWVNWKLYVDLNSSVTHDKYNGSVAGSNQTTQTGTASTKYDSDKTVLIKEGRYTWNRTTANYTVSITGAVSASSSGGSNPWNGEKVSTTQTFTVLARPKYTLTYNSNGGSAVAPGGNFYGYTVTVGGPPVRDGYVFQYWDCGGNKWLPGQTVTMTANYIFTAVWARSVLSFNANREKGGYDVELADQHGGGVMIGGDGAISRNGAPWTVAMPGSLPDPADPGGINLVKKGYHIEAGREWNSKADGSGSEYDARTVYSTDTFPASTTLYANWKPNTYTVAFYPNGDGDVTGTMPDQTLTVDKTENIYSNSFIRPGYRLAGWDTDPSADPSGSLTVTGDKGTVLNLSRIQDDNIRLYAVWRPVEETEAEIYAGKVVKTYAGQDAYTFRIEPVEGWSHENESSELSGRAMPADELPMPEGTPDGQRYKDVEITGLSGNPDVLRSGSMGVITFEDPGWYMYRVSEVIPDQAGKDIKYDRSSYYVVVYVEYKEEKGTKVRVGSTTAWHNSRGSGRNRPDLRDISEITDNGGAASLENAEGVYGKTGSGTNGVLVRFWNEEKRPDEPTEELVSLRVSKNVRGELGDITKKFRFSAVITGLAASATYSIVNDGAELAEGFAGEAVRTDAEGKAEMSFLLRDDEGLSIEDMPPHAKVSITEAQSDHHPAYIFSTESGRILKQDSLNRNAELSTGQLSMDDAGEMYCIDFTNTRDPAPVTGAADRAIHLAVLMGIVLIGICIAVKQNV